MATGTPIQLPPTPGARWDRAWWKHCAVSIFVTAVVVAAVEQVVYATGLTVGPGIHVVWPVNGVGLALLVLWGWRCWPGLLLGFLVQPLLAPADVAGLSYTPEEGWYLWQLAGLITVDVGQITATAAAVRWITGRDAMGETLSNAVKLLVVAGFLGPLVNMVGSMAVLRAGGRIGWEAMPGFAATWFTSDLLGVLVFLPMIVVWSSPSAWRLVGASWKVFLAGVLGLAGVLALAFSPLGDGVIEAMGLSRGIGGLWVYALLLPLLAWLVLRFAQPGATLAMFVVSAAAVVGTAWGYGPLVPGSRPGAAAGAGVGGGASWIDTLTLAVIEVQVLLASLAVTMRLAGAVVAERAAQQAQLAEQRDRLRRLGREMAETEQRERRDLATRLHDGMHQHLAVARIELKNTTAPADDHLARACDEVDRAVEASRSVINDLAPPTLTALGLPAALSALARRFESAHGLPVLFQDESGGHRASEPTEAFLYRATRELLFNVIKHAGATRAGVVLRVEQSPTPRVMLGVWDDGRGFCIKDVLEKTPLRDPGFGLFSVQQHALALGGTLRVTTGGQTTVWVEVPG